MNTLYKTSSKVNKKKENIKVVKKKENAKVIKRKEDVKVVKKNRNLLAKLKKKLKPLKHSVDEKENKLIKKEIKRYKLNLLRNRPIEFQLKNLNSNQKLSFYRKSKLV